MESSAKETRGSEEPDNEKWHPDAGSVHQLSRMPGECPVGKCSDIVFPSNLMLHMLHTHDHATNRKQSEIYDHRPFMMSFDPNLMEFERNYCLATLLYGGIKSKQNTQPARDNLCLPNMGLLTRFLKYQDYMPLVLMGCHTSWFAHIRDKRTEHELLMKSAGRAGIYVFWLAAPVTTRKLYYTLTVFDRQYTSSRSCIRVVRNFTDFQNPSEFLPNDENYLLLRDCDMVELMGINSSMNNIHWKPSCSVPIEVIVYQSPIIPNSLAEGSPDDPQATPEEVKSIYSNFVMPRIKGSGKRSVSGKMSVRLRPKPDPASK